MLRSPAIFSFSVLASGSKGNSVYIENSATRILIDAGLGIRALTQRMESIGRSPADLTALFITHEHSDHMRGAGMLAKKYKLPVYATRGTFSHLERVLPPQADRRVLQQEDSVTLGGLEVESYPTPHDGEETVAFVVRCGGRKVGHATDLGCVDWMVMEKLRECDALLLESNHDVAMLRNGTYPWPLKQRILGRHGHLSNEASADLLAAVQHDALQTVILMHLSEQNNCPDLARTTAARVLGNLPARLGISRQDQATPLLSVE